MKSLKTLTVNDFERILQDAENWRTELTDELFEIQSKPTQRHHPETGEPSLKFTRYQEMRVTKTSTHTPTGLTLKMDSGFEFTPFEPDSLKKEQLNEPYFSVAWEDAASVVFVDGDGDEIRVDEYDFIQKLDAEHLIETDVDEARKLAPAHLNKLIVPIQIEYQSNEYPLQEKTVFGLPMYQFAGKEIARVEHQHASGDVTSELVLWELADGSHAAYRCDNSKDINRSHEFFGVVDNLNELLPAFTDCYSRNDEAYELMRQKLIELDLICDDSSNDFGI